MQPGAVIAIVDHLAIARCQWWPLPACWPLPLDAEILAAEARREHAQAEHLGAVGGKPKFAGVFATIAYSWECR